MFLHANVSEKCLDYYRDEIASVGLGSPIFLSRRRKKDGFRKRALIYKMILLEFLRNK